jgi:hypothetical protein
MSGKPHTSSTRFGAAGEPVAASSLKPGDAAAKKITIDATSQQQACRVAITEGPNLWRDDSHIAYLGRNGQGHGRPGWSKKDDTSGRSCSTLTNQSKSIKAIPFANPRC